MAGKTDLEQLADFLLDAAEKERAANSVKYVDPFSPDGLTFGKQLYLREISPAEADAYQASLHKEDIRIHGKEFGGRLERVYENQRGRFVVLVLADEQGRRIFKDAQAEAVGNKFGVKRIDDIYLRGLRLNEMDEAGAEASKKNLTSTNGSGTSLPSNSESQTPKDSNGACPSLSSTAG